MDRGEFVGPGTRRAERLDSAKRLGERRRGGLANVSDPESVDEAIELRLAAGIVTVLLSLVALVVTNLGGFLVGTILSLLGGALAVAWTNEPKEPKKAKHEHSAELEPGAGSDSEPGPEQTQRVQPT